EPKACVLVTDGDERSALAVTRALGRAGIPVVVGAETARSLAGASRYCVATWQYPSPLKEGSKFVPSLVEAVERFDITTIMPVTDATMQVIAAQRDRFPPSLTRAIPSVDKYDLVSDKYRLMQLAHEMGVPIPDTVFVENGRLPQDMRNVGDYPLIVKPGRSLVLADSTWTKTAVQHVANRRELEQLYEETPYLRRPSLIQRRVEGEGQGIFALCDRGNPVALFAHRRLREKPPSGGVSVLRESIEQPKAMAEYAVRLLQNIGWHGVAMVEFKVEKETGIPRLMEINGRFWGSLQLALDAGINFPFLVYQLATGQPVAVAPTGYRVGVKSRWLLGDLDHLLIRIFNTDKVLRLSPGYPSRTRCALEFMRFFQKGLHYEVESPNDPAPSFYEMRMYLKALVKGDA
ncbi:MAG TPA: ATP-grasp domain-containing protein, partial [Nitrospira sp.]|nr:ATP-grasp domain-containing protein [Nitrospira sp.]